VAEAMAIIRRWANITTRIVLTAGLAAGLRRSFAPPGKKHMLGLCPKPPESIAFWATIWAGKERAERSALPIRSATGVGTRVALHVDPSSAPVRAYIMNAKTWYYGAGPCLKIGF